MSSFISHATRSLTVRTIILGLATLPFWGCTTDSTTDPNTNNNNPKLTGSIYFNSERQTSKIASLNLTSGAVTTLYEGGTPSVTPEGTVVTTGATGLIERNGPQVRTIVASDLNNGFDVTYDDYMNDPRVSPNGAYVTYYGSNVYSSVYIVDRQSGELVASVDATNTESYTHPSWTRDNRLIVEGNSIKNRGIYMADADLTQLSRIDPNLSNPQYPVASPVSDQIAFVQDGDVWVMNYDGSGLRQLAQIEGDEVWPVWSPDGKWIACVGSGRVIYVIPLNGTTVYKLNDLYSQFATESNYTFKTYGIDWK